MKQLAIALFFAAILAITPCIAEEVPKELEGLPLLFSDDFENGHEQWEMTDPKAWKIIEEDGRKVLALVRNSNYEPEVRSPKNIAEIKGLNVSDFIMEVRLKSTSREYGHRDMCVFFNKVDASHFYYAHLATEADPHANSIFLVNGEPRVSIALQRTDGTTWDNEYHTIRVKRYAASGAIEVYFDDMDDPAMIAEDTHFISGTLGIGSFDDPGQFDYVRVWGKTPDKDTADNGGEN